MVSQLHFYYVHELGELMNDSLIRGNLHVDETLSYLQAIMCFFAMTFCISKTYSASNMFVSIGIRCFKKLPYFLLLR